MSTTVDIRRLKFNVDYTNEMFSIFNKIAPPIFLNRFQPQYIFPKVFLNESLQYICSGKFAQWEPNWFVEVEGWTAMA